MPPEIYASLPFSRVDGIIMRNTDREENTVLGVAYFAVYLLSGYAVIRSLRGCGSARRSGSC